MVGRLATASFCPVAFSMVVDKIHVHTNINATRRTQHKSGLQMWASPAAGVMQRTVNPIESAKASSLDGPRRFCHVLVQIRCHSIADPGYMQAFADTLALYFLCVLLLLHFCCTFYASPSQGILWLAGHRRCYHI